MIKPTAPSFVRSALLGACLAASVAAGFCGAGQAAAASWSWGGEQVQGSGRIVKQNRQVSGFSGLSLGTPGRVELRIGNSESVTVEADDNVLPLIETVVEDGVLKIRPARRNLALKSASIRVVVQARSIERLSLGGSGSIHADPLRARGLDIDVGGSGSIQLKGVDAGTLSVSLAGSGDVEAAGGNVEKLSVSIKGSGDVDLGRVQAGGASVSVAGSGDAVVWPRNRLGVSIAGSGDVKYYGDPQVSKSVAGSGEVKRVGASPR